MTEPPRAGRPDVSSSPRHERSPTCGVTRTPYPWFQAKRALAAGAIIGSDRLEEAGMYWHDGWDWFWMTVAMSFWVALLGVVVYVAVRLALGDREREREARRRRDYPSGV
ncbi:MAG TPA: hypothetical protein VNJ53_13430 [Gaiellaceae bacterium]|nr:hypothetical protein [Gaiellaceae bacterium]